MRITFHSKGGRDTRKAVVVLAALCTTIAAWAQPPLQAELRVLTHNVFGKSDAYCDQRAHGFGNILAHANPAFDIVGLTEYYSISDFDLLTCDSEHLLNAIRCTGRYTANANSRLFYPEAELLPPNEFDGGLGLFTTGTICDFAEMEFTHQPPGPLPHALQGTILCRIRVPGTNLTVDAYVVHIHSTGNDGCDYCCRRQELQELHDFIAQHSRRSGNPVLVMGDFNIAGPPTCCGPKGYADILEQLGHPRDLWLEAHACSQHTCGDTLGPCEDNNNDDCSRIECSPGFPTPDMTACVSGATCGDTTCSIVAPQPTECNPGTPAWRGGSGYTWDACLNDLIPGTGLERIDYIFILRDPALSSSAFSIDVDPMDVRVTNFMAIIAPPGPESPFVGHISDHFGVEATLQVSGRSAVWVDHLASGPADGSSCNPFSTVAEGVSAVATGDRVLVRAGSYSPALTIARPLLLQAIGGTVMIGRR